MFSRRQKLGFSRRFKELCWPTMGLRRTLHYFHLRLMRVSASADPVARGIACGLTVSFFPIFGIHALMGIALAYVIRGNVLAAIIGTLVVPPVILPLVFSLDFLVGQKILTAFGWHAAGPESEFQREAASGLEYMRDHFFELFLPAFVGSVLFMVLVWPATYMAAHKLLEVLGRRHEKRKNDRRDKREREGRMIIGIGEDTCDIRRIEKALERHGDRFIARCFTETERAKAARRHGAHEPAATLAKRFAAKEACSKALGTGFRDGVSLRSIGVINAPSGAPALELTGGAARRLESLVPPGKTPRIHLTLGDEYPYAKALVIIEVLDDPAPEPQG